jgi:hypothetical protein
MTENTTLNNTAFQQAVLRFYFLLAVAVGVFAMGSILSIPGEAGDAAFLGLSLQRATLVGVVLLVTGTAAWLLIKASLKRSWFLQFTDVILARLADDRVYGSVLIFAILGILNGANFIARFPGITEPVTLAYYVRLRPVVLWIAILCGQSLLGIHFLRYGFSPRKPGLKDPRLHAFGLVLGFLALLTIWISVTGYGITPIDEGVGWYPLGTPLLSVQVLLAWGISMGAVGIWTWAYKRTGGEGQDKKFRLDSVLGFLLWLAAFVLWMSQPLKPNWFASEPRPPNEVFYPNSDASVYDITAQNLALGEGFKTRGAPFTLRPFYAAFLAGLHAFGGASYESIIWMQVAVLAFMPVFLYRITARIHNRFSGLLGALLLILRETNAIRLGDTISDAHVKLLMPFLPTTFGILLTILVAVMWLQTSSKRTSLPLVFGGLVGIFMLVRPEVGVLIPFIGFAALLHLRKRSTEWVRGMTLITLGLVLSLAPWIWRNYQLTGTIFIDSPNYRLDLITRRYREDPLGFVPTPMPDPTQADSITLTLQPVQQAANTSVPETDQRSELTSEPQNTHQPENILDVSATPTTVAGLTPQPGESIQDQTGRLVDDALDFAQANPAYLTNFILSHFTNSQVQTILNLPVSYPFSYSTINYLGHKSLSQFWVDCCTLTGYVHSLPFWPRWGGVFPSESIMPLVINLIVVALGISTAWRKHKFIGLVPLFAALGYYLINALVRNSGGRYILPTDWISYFYFSIGLTQITLWGVSFFRHHPGVAFSEADPTKILPESPPASRWSLLGFACGFLLLGSILPILERATPPKFGDTSIESRVADILGGDQALFDDAEKEVLKIYLENGGTTLYGTALYPRFHKPYQMGSVWYFYQDRPFANLDFYLSSPHDTGIVLRTSQSPSRFPHASEVLVFACPEYTYYDALAVILYGEDGNPTDVLWRFPLPNPLTCPLAPP